MSSVFPLILLIALTINNCVAGFKWKSNTMDKQTFHANQGDNVLFPWDFTLEDDEHLSLIQYFLNSELIANVTENQLIATDQYASRLAKSGDGGLELHNAIVADSGDLTIKVQVTKGEDNFTSERTAIFKVAKNLEEVLDNIQTSIKTQIDHHSEDHDKIDALETEIDQLKNNMSVLQAREKINVAFHVHGLEMDVFTEDEEILKFTRLTLNTNEGYNLSSGVFTAPHSGYYYFATTSKAQGKEYNYHSEIYITIDGKPRGVYGNAYRNGRGKSTSLHLTCHLNEGQKVAVHARNAAKFWPDQSSFMGFLINLDY